jgi:hypothetical protein
MHILIDINKSTKPLYFPEFKNCKLSFIALNKSLKNKVLEANVKNKFYLYPGTDKKHQHDVDTCPSFNYDKQVELIINDYRLMSMFERSYKLPISNSLRVAEIIYKITLINNFINEKQFTHYAIYASPHNIDNWIFSIIFKCRGLEVIYLQESFLSWRYYLVSENQYSLYLNQAIKSRDYQYDEILYYQYKDRYQSIKDNMASFVKRDMECNNGRVYNIWSDFKREWRRPDLFINKYRSYRTYSKILRKTIYDINKPFVYFPLHYQPERSTLPEGGGYASQLRAIFLLASKLPDEVNIFIKEHPSTFFYQCHWLERSPNWYEKLNSIDKVKFLPIEKSSATFIDNSIFTASINGTLATESVFRNKSVVLFAKTRYLGYESKLINFFKSESHLESLVSRLLSEYKHSNATISTRLNRKDIYEKTFTHDINDSMNIDSIEKNWVYYREDVWRKALLAYIKKETIKKKIE